MWDAVTLVAVAKRLHALASTITPLATTVASVCAHLLTAERTVPEKSRETSRRVMVVV
jgi:hypothetical protein